MPPSEVTHTVDTVVEWLTHHAPGEPVGVWLHGSAVTAEQDFGPDSDIDLLMMTRRSLRADERWKLAQFLLGVSGWSGHAETFPEVSSRRPIELTSLVAHRRAFEHQIDLQFGEWLREAVQTDPAQALAPHSQADLPVLLSIARTSHLSLFGPPLDEVLDPVPSERLRDARLQRLPELFAELDEDPHNVLLTLARMVVASETGEYVGKAQAAQQIAPRLAPSQASALLQARAHYLGVADANRTTTGGGTHIPDITRRAAKQLAAWVS